MTVSTLHKLRRLREARPASDPKTVRVLGSPLLFPCALTAFSVGCRAPVASREPQAFLVSKVTE